jgi:hypothetical protein
MKVRISNQKQINIATDGGQQFIVQNKNSRISERSSKI